MAASAPDCGHTTISARALALIVDGPRLRRLRVAYRADPVYPELLAVSAAVLGGADATNLAIAGGTRNAGYMSASEYAAAAGLTANAVRRACREGRIRAERRSGVWLIPVAELAMRGVA